MVTIPVEFSYAIVQTVEAISVFMAAIIPALTNIEIDMTGIPSLLSKQRGIIGLQYNICNIQCGSITHVTQSLNRAVTALTIYFPGSAHKNRVNIYKVSIPLTLESNKGDIPVNTHSKIGVRSCNNWDISLLSMPVITRCCADTDADTQYIPGLQSRPIEYRLSGSLQHKV